MPAIAQTCGAQIPAALTTISVAIGQTQAGHPNARPDPNTCRSGCRGEGVRRRVRVEMSVARQPHAAVQVAPGDRGQQADYPVGVDEVRVETDRARPAQGPLELAELVAARRDSDAADGVKHAERLIELDTVTAEREHRRGGIEHRHEAHRLAGRTGRQLRLLDEEDIVLARPGEVVGDAAAGDPAADDDDARLVRRHSPAASRN